MRDGRRGKDGGGVTSSRRVPSLNDTNHPALPGRTRLRGLLGGGLARPYGASPDRAIAGPTVRGSGPQAGVEQEEAGAPSGGPPSGNRGGHGAPHRRTHPGSGCSVYGIARFRPCRRQPGIPTFLREADGMERRRSCAGVEYIGARLLKRIHRPRLRSLANRPVAGGRNHVATNEGGHKDPGRDEKDQQVNPLNPDRCGPMAQMSHSFAHDPSVYPNPPGSFRGS